MPTIQHIDLNCDLGEGYDDAAIMPYISSCNIACGGHFGDEQSITECIMLAQAHQVNIGAHPSYPDKVNFGRKSLDIDITELEIALSKQLKDVLKICSAQNVKLNHIKPHGALYNDMAQNYDLAYNVMSTFHELSPQVLFYGMAHSQMELVAADLKIDFVPEAFADRRYLNLNELQSRSEEGAVIQNKEDLLAQLDLILKAQIIDHKLRTHELRAATICLHSDTPQAVKLARLIHSHLKVKGIDVH